MFSASAGLTEAIRQGLEVLGIERLVLAIHDQSFPSTSDEDIGRGSPYGRGARALIRFVEELGFDGLQLGPQGDTSLDNPSPYDGALFSKSPLSVALGTLEDDPLWAPLARGLLPPMVDGRPPEAPHRVSYTYAWRRSREAVAALFARFREPRGAAPAILRDRFAAFCAAQPPPVQADADFEALAAQHGTDDWRRWPGPTTGQTGQTDQLLWCPPPALAAAAQARRDQLRRERAADIEPFLFGQFVLAEQHRALRAAFPGVALFGDLQIGFSHRDVWSRRALFRADYLMGAPPSRTNPLGQPWGYPVLDPDQFAGPVLALLTARVDRMLADFDGLRIDHPHGLVCPWVYAAADPDPAAAVSRGARLLCSPNLPDHPALAALAIPTADQLSHDPGITRYADDWVRELRPEQVARYGLLFDGLMARVAAAGRKQSDVVCEVLSTWPFPLRAVMSRYGLGRFCVTQKGDLGRRDDVYRSENAAPEDWIMVGNHDTPSVWALTDAWHGTAPGRERAAYLAEQLMPIASLRPRLIRWLQADGRHLAQAMFADLFASRARRISVFFTDLLGMRELYNRPGIVDPTNWTLRVPSNFEDLYRQALVQTNAFNVPLALALALVARGESDTATTTRRLLDAARQLTPSLDPEIVSIIETALRSPRPAERGEG